MKRLMLLVVMSTVPVWSQTPAQTMAPADTVNALITGVGGLATGLLKAMPADKYGFAPSQAIFQSAQITDYTGVKTFGELVIHTTQANYGLAARLNGSKPDVDVQALAKLKDKEEIVAAFEASLAFVHKVASTITPANAFEAVKGPIPGMTRVTGAAFVAVHMADEYGQLVEYARMNGVVPPASQKK